MIDGGQVWIGRSTRCRSIRVIRAHLELKRVVTRLQAHAHQHAGAANQHGEHLAVWRASKARSTTAPPPAGKLRLPEPTYWPPGCALLLAADARHSHLVPHQVRARRASSFATASRHACHMATRPRPTPTTSMNGEPSSEGRPSYKSTCRGVPAQPVALRRTAAAAHVAAARHACLCRMQHKKSRGPCPAVAGPPPGPAMSPPALARMPCTRFPGQQRSRMHPAKA